MIRSGDLSDNEKNFRDARSKVTMKAIQDLLGDKGPKSLKETPTVALAISGGGYRAVSTSCGAMEALMEKDLFDALMYSVGLSGSVWYLSATYSRESFSSLEKLKQDHDWIRGRLGKEMNFNPFTAVAYAFKSKFNGQKLSLADAFGVALGDILLADGHMNNKMSSFKEYVKDGKVPLPIFSTAHVKNNHPFFDFWEEVELTPFEATYASYRLLVPVEHVNSVWNNGVLKEVREEPSLHYVMGFCGSAFAILLYHLTDGNELRERGFFGAIWAIIKKGALNFGKFLTGGYASIPERIILSEEQFKREIWEPILSLAAEEDGDLLSEEDAYQLYVLYAQSEDDDWLVDAIDLLQHLPKEDWKTVNFCQPTSVPYSVEVVGRNIGFFRRTGFLRNPVLGMPSSLEKYMMDDKPAGSKKSGAAKRIRAKASTKDEEILVIDSGIGCNVPAVHVVRPQRKVDVIIVVDCETKGTDKDSKNVFDTLKATQSQMRDNDMKFPTVDIEKLKQDPVQEYYLFEDPDDPDCPVVIWFTLYNVRFRDLVNAPRSDEYPPQANDGQKFNDFDVSPDAKEYSTTNLQYSPRDVDRLRELMRYNIGENIEVIKEKLAQKVAYLRFKK